MRQLNARCSGHGHHYAACGGRTPVILLTTFDEPAHRRLQRTRGGDPAPVRRRLGQAGNRQGGIPFPKAVFLSEVTVKNHVSEILDKLGTRDRTRAVLKAITLQIL